MTKCRPSISRVPQRSSVPAKSRASNQPITGAALAWHVGYSLAEGWIALSIILYIFTGAFWLPVVWMQMKMHRLAEAAVAADVPLPAEYHELFWRWFAFGFPAFAAVLAIFWLMISRPDLGTWI